MSVVIEAATAFCAISDAICIISCFISSMACFFSSSASSLALFMMREASSFASSTILFWFLSAFCLASVRIASASLSMSLSFPSYSAFSAAALSLSAIAVFISLSILSCLSFYSFLAGLKSRYDISLKRKNTATAKSTVSKSNCASRLNKNVYPCANNFYSPFRWLYRRAVILCGKP